MNIFIRENIFSLSGKLTLVESAKFNLEMLKALQTNQGQEITLEMSGLSEIDSAGVATLEEIIDFCQRKKIGVRLSNAGGKVKRTMTTFSLKKEGILPIAAEQIGFFEEVGGKFFTFRSLVMEFMYMAVDTFYWSFRDLFKGKGRLEGSFVNQSVLIGVNALPIVSLLSFLVGFVLALQSAAQLRQFGANIFLAHLIAISMTREMGPLMTAIIIAGRSGSSFASEISSMKVSEELDALKTMALNPIRFVVVPKFYAMTLCVPLLTILADVIGIAGGFFVAVTYLGLSPMTFFNEVIKVMIIKDIVTSIIKSFVFAWIIVLVGSFYGFQAEGGPEGVGRVTTQSVVVSIFMVIVADSLLGLIFYF